MCLLTIKDNTIKYREDTWLLHQGAAFMLCGVTVLLDGGHCEAALMTRESGTIFRYIIHTLFECNSKYKGYGHCNVTGNYMWLLSKQRWIHLTVY